MEREPYSDLLSFLTRLESAKIHYTLEHNRGEAVMISIAVPGERWEVEFMRDGSVEVERFISTGAIEDRNLLDELFLKHAELP